MDLDNILDDGLIHRKDSNEDFAEIIKLKREAVEAEKKVTGGRTVSWILIFFTVIAAIYESTLYIDPLIIIGIYAIILSLYIGGTVYSLQNAKIGLIIVLVVFSLVQILVLTSDPIGFIQGILFKGIFLYFIIQGVIGGTKLVKIQKRLSDLGVNS